MDVANYANGVKLEYMVKDFYRAHKYWVTRSAGSHGCIDLIAWRVEQGCAYVDLVQCKKGSSPVKKDVEEMRKLPIDETLWRRLLWIKKGDEIIVQQIFIDKVCDVERLKVKDVKKAIEVWKDGNA